MLKKSEYYYLILAIKALIGELIVINLIVLIFKLNPLALTWSMLASIICIFFLWILLSLIFWIYYLIRKITYIWTKYLNYFATWLMIFGFFFILYDFWIGLSEDNLTTKISLWMTEGEVEKNLWKAETWPLTHKTCTNFMEFTEKWIPFIKDCQGTWRQVFYDWRPSLWLWVTDRYFIICYSDNNTVCKMEVVSR